MDKNSTNYSHECLINIQNDSNKNDPIKFPIKHNEQTKF